MPFTPHDILYGGVLPAAVALTLMLILRRLLSDDVGERWTPALSLLAGLMTGYGLLSLGPLAPDAHWHWLPFVLAGATITGPVTALSELKSFERLLLVALISTVAAWFLVPEWDDLDPSRTTWLCGFVIFSVLLTSLLHPLERRRTGPLLPIVLWATLTAAAVVLALSGSLRFAQIALAGAASLFAIAIVALWRRDQSSTVGLSLPFCLLTIGILLIGRVNTFSDVPWASWLLVPMAPASLWLTSIGPVSRWTGLRRTAAELLLPILILGGSILLAVLAEGTDAGGY